MNRLGILQAIEPYIGKFYSAEWVKHNVLNQTDDEIVDMADAMEDELKSGDPALTPTPLEVKQMELQMGQDMQMNQHQSALRQDEIKVQGQSKPKTK